MQPSLDKLRKFFRLEAEQGYNNRAIIGGFARMVDSWEAEARQDGLPEDLIQAVTQRLRGYHLLSPNSRRETLYGLWRRIERTTGISAEKTPPRSAPKKKTPPREAAAPPQGESKPAPRAAAPSAESPPTPKSAAPPALPIITFEELEAPITEVHGIGPRNAKTLAEAGIHTLRDLLYYFPRRYVDYSTLKPIRQLRYGETVTVIGTVRQVHVRRLQRKSGPRQVVEALLDDGSGVLRISWFNQPWIAKRLQNQPQISVSGKIDQYLGRLVMTNPEWEPITQQQLSTNRIVPVYPLTAKMTQNWLRKRVHATVQTWAPRLPDPLPEALREQAGLMPLPQALLQVHYPDSTEHLQSARHRLGFDEIFLLQLGLLGQRRQWKSGTALRVEMPEEWLQARLAALPFSLTSAQRRALEDIRSDMASGRPMNRLLQGDVGSGKTVVAALAIAAAVHNGTQGALMAPTSILAEQHARNLRRFLPEANVRLMVGATPAREKAEIRAGLESGEIQVVVGTHALIEEAVQFQALGLAVIDEQHRFGVQQRGALRRKGHNPHLLVMTATPIPRSLALTIYGDLDLSVMDEMPPGRQPVHTFVISPLERERAYTLIRNQVEDGRQAFIIYPLVEESEKSESKAAVEEHARLQEVFPRFKLGLLHGRMKPAEKEEVMARFRDGEFEILVSTSVVEVGVDVPNATVMLIEGANRFGLAQLHQFRGRVGRGAHQSYCVLIPERQDAVGNERLLAMAETEDGFVLAERDLEQRGPGEFLGTRQSGFGNLRMANLTDVRLIEKARRFAQQVFEQDPELQQSEHALLARALQHFWQHANPTDVS